MGFFGLFGKEKSFRDLMKEYNDAYGDPQKRINILLKASKKAKDLSEKMEVNCKLNDLKQRGR